LWRCRACEHLGRPPDQATAAAHQDTAETLQVQREQLDRTLDQQRTQLTETLQQQREQLDRTLAEQREQLAKTLSEQRVRLFSERYAAAAEALGHGKSATRLAGVYAFAALADEWKEQQQTCIDVLCGYIRFPYQPMPGLDGYQEGEREVRHSLIRVIRDHLRDDAAVSWRGRIFRFHHATFDGGDLSQIRMSDGYMSFYGAKICDGLLDFRGAKFSGGTVDFLEAEFSGGRVDFRRAKLSGGEVKFPRAIFSGSEVNFQHAKLQSGSLSFQDATFSAGTVDVRHALFTGALIDFSQSSFSGGSVDLRDPEEVTEPPKVPDPRPTGLLGP
jgi:hypothetical protein